MSYVYRSPSITHPEIIPELNKLFNLKVSDKNRYDLRLIVGDFNMKEINWESGRLSSKLLRQGYVMERLKSSLRKFYGRYGDIIKHYEVSLSQMLHDILGHDHIQ